MTRRSARPPRMLMVFLICLLAVPTVYGILHPFTGGLTLEILQPYLLTGAILGVAQLLLRPVLRLISAPLGCLTLGLSGTAIDIALIYFSASLVPGFAVPDFLYAALTALTVNAAAFICAGRR